MSSAGISFGGLASGLDTKAIITALVGVERRPILAMEGKKTSLNRQKSLYSDLDALLGKLGTAAKALKTTTDFLAFKAASSDETVLKATASNTAAAGTYTARVVQLAQAQISASPGQSSPTSALAGGSDVEFTITVNGNPAIIALNNPSLSSIAAKINAEDDANDIGVRAEVVDTGDTANSGSSRYQLVLHAKNTGSAGAFSVTLDSSPTANSALANVINGLGGTPITAAQDAKIRLSPDVSGQTGILVTRSSNQITDLWPGVSVDLLSVANPDKNITVTVTRDTEASSKKMQDFVDAYNKVVDFAVEQNALGADGKAKNPLFGDPTLRSLRTNLRNSVNAQVTDTGNSAYQLLSQVGIKSDTAGKLTFDHTKFEDALNTDEDAVTKLFTNTTTGIASRLAAQVDIYEKSDGLLANRTESLGRMVKDTQTRIDKAEQRITSYQKQLEAKYASLESLLTKLQSQGSAVRNIG